VTLDELRGRFWWLGPSTRDSYIVGIEGDTVTIKCIQCTWNRQTQKYEDAVERDFAALGLKVAWQPLWSPAREADIEKARAAALKKKEAFDEEAFIEGKRREELRLGSGNDSGGR
jgi:hypothetical protein